MPTRRRAPHPARYVRRRVDLRPGARPVAALALLAALVGWGLVLWGVAGHVLFSVLLFVGVPVWLAAVFSAITSLGPRRTTSTVVAVVSGTGIVAATLARELTQDGWQSQGLLGMLVLTLAALAARYALTVPPPSGIDLFAIPPERRATRHPVLVINLRSGGGRAEEHELPQLCARLGIEAVILEPDADLEELAREATRRGADALGMAGGDGSLAVVAGVAHEAGIPFVCVPAGTRNHFALDLGLDRDDPTQALGAFIEGEIRRVDLATVNETMFLNNVSLGLYAAIVEQDSYRDAKLETSLGMLPALFEEGGPWFDLHLDVPDHGRLERAAIVQVSNNPYVLAGQLGRRERLDAGQLGIVTVDPRRVGDLVGLTVLAAARKPEWSSALWHWAAPTFEVGSGQPELAAGVDGETVMLRPPLRFAVEHRCLDVLVPRGTRVGLAEQHRGAKGTYAGLLEVAFGLERPDT
jgi:diacylglycerol kinase family enzyme